MEAIVHYGALFALVSVIFLFSSRLISRIPEEKIHRETFIERLTSFKSPLSGIIVVAVVLTIMLATFIFVAKQWPVFTRYYFIFVFWLSTHLFFLKLKEAGSKIISHRVIVSMASVCVIGIWLLRPNWLTVNIVATLSAVAILVLLRTISLRALTLFGIGVVIYDVIAVFSTKKMIELASSMSSMPLLISIPKSFDLSSAPFTMLGLGDIVIPGTLIMACVVTKNRTMQMFGAIGYFFGLAVALTVLSLTHSAQPATIYLIPGTLLGIFLATKKERKLKEAFF